MKTKGSRNQPQTSTVADALENGRSAVEELREEINEWKESLEGNSMEHLPKYEEVSECCDALDEAVSTLEEAEIEGSAFDRDVFYTIDTRRSATSRASRMMNAGSALFAAKYGLEQWLVDNPELDDAQEEEDTQQRETDRAAAETALDALERGIDSAESACFPGMY